MTDLAFKEELRAEMRLNRAAMHEVRQVNRTLVVAVGDNTEAVRDMRDDVHAMRDDVHAMRDDMRAMRRAVQENTDAIKAVTEAIFHVLDELRGRGPSAGTT